MSVFHSLNTSASALTAQRLRMDVISSNMANAQTTRAVLNDNGEYEPYRRKMVVFEPQERSFKSHLQRATRQGQPSQGVRVSRIVEDESPFKMIYQPDHPDANEAGYVQLPNVDPLRAMVDLMSATRSYEANITTFNATKQMLMKALEIGR